MARRWWLFLLVALVVLGATAYLTYRQSPRYEARVTYITRVNDTITDGRDINSALDVLNRQDDVLSTYSEIAKSQMIKTKADQSLGAQTRGLQVNSRLIPGTNILEISVQGEDPFQVRDYANSIGTQTAAYVNTLYPTYRLEQLDQAEAPGKPVSPNTMLNLLVGGILGLFLGFLVLLISAGMSGGFRETYTPVPVTSGTVPAFQSELDELKKQSTAIRDELSEARKIFHDTMIEAKTLSRTLHETNGQIHNK